MKITIASWSYKALRAAARKRKAVPRAGFNSTLPKSKSRPKKVNASRKAREFQRAYGSKERVTWVRGLVCLAFGIPGGGCDGPIENAHVENDGVGRKADARFIVPLCRKHHRHLHVIGVEAFGRAYKTDLHYGARLVEQSWAHRGQEQT